MGKKIMTETLIYASYQTAALWKQDQDFISIEYYREIVKWCKWLFHSSFLNFLFTVRKTIQSLWQ